MLERLQLNAISNARAADVRDRRKLITDRMNSKSAHQTRDDQVRRRVGMIRHLMCPIYVLAI